MENNNVSKHLTPWDGELMLMVESLTGKPVEPRHGGDGYFFEADYSLHPDPDYISAIFGAIEGRAGKRCIEINDDPERKVLMAHIAFSDEVLPGLAGSLDIHKPCPSAGRFYIDESSRIVAALQVRAGSVQDLITFVGNGEMEIPKDGPASFHFLNADASVVAHAREFEYIVFQRPGLFSVVSKAEFENEYHLFE